VRERACCKCNPLAVPPRLTPSRVGLRQVVNGNYQTKIGNTIAEYITMVRGRARPCSHGFRACFRRSGRLPSSGFCWRHQLPVNMPWN